MILHFLNINSTSFIRIVVLFLGLVAPYRAFSVPVQEFSLPDKSGVFYWKCAQEYCSTFLKKNNEGQKLIIANTSAPEIEALDNHTIRLFFSCGSPCNYSIFYDTDKGISAAFEFVIAVNAKQKIVVVTEDNQLVGYKIFGHLKKPLFDIKRNWSHTAVLFTAILEAKFIDNDFFIKYLEGDKYTEKDEIIHNIIGGR